MKTTSLRPSPPESWTTTSAYKVSRPEGQGPRGATFGEMPTWVGQAHRFWGESSVYNQGFKIRGDRKINQRYTLEMWEQRRPPVHNPGPDLHRFLWNYQKGVVWEMGYAWSNLVNIHRGVWKTFPPGCRVWGLLASKDRLRIQVGTGGGWVLNRPEQSAWREQTCIGREKRDCKQEISRGIKTGNFEAEHRSCLSYFQGVASNVPVPRCASHWCDLKCTLYFCLGGSITESGHDFAKLD